MTGKGAISQGLKGKMQKRGSTFLGVKPAIGKRKTYDGGAESGVPARGVKKGKGKVDDPDARRKNQTQGVPKEAGTGSSERC